MLDSPVLAPKPGTGAEGANVAEADGVGETDVLAAGGRDAEDVADMVECTSVLDICFDKEEIAHPARTPAAPVAELTRPA